MKAVAVRFSLYYAALFLVIGIALPFWPAWLASRGLDAAEISVVLSVAIWLRVFANPVIAHFADRTGAHKATIVLAAVGATVAYVLLHFVYGFWGLLLVNLVASILFMTLIPLGENLASRAATSHGFDYGRVRLWGSISFIAASYVAGALLERTGDHLILWMVVVALLATLLGAFALPRERERHEVSTHMPALVLLRDRGFLIFLGAASLLQASHAVLYMFGTIHWRAAGISDSVIGALWAEGVLAEILLFAFSKVVVDRVGPIRLMAIAVFAGVVRWTVLAVSTDVLVLFSVQWLHGLTFGALHLAIIFYLLRNVPYHMSASAQSIYSGFAVGFVMGLTMLAGGWLYAETGGAAFYAMAVASVVGGVFTLLLSRHHGRSDASS